MVEFMIWRSHFILWEWKGFIYENTSKVWNSQRAGIVSFLIPLSDNDPMRDHIPPISQKAEVTVMCILKLNSLKIICIVTMDLNTTLDINVQYELLPQAFYNRLLRITQFYCNLEILFIFWKIQSRSWRDEGTNRVASYAAASCSDPHQRGVYVSFSASEPNSSLKL